MCSRLQSFFRQNKRSFCHIDVLLVFVIPLFSPHPKDPCSGSCPKNSSQPLSSSQLLMLRGFFFFPFPFGFVFSVPSRLKINFWLTLWSTFYTKYTQKSVGNTAESCWKTGIFLSFWEIIHSNSSPRIILKCFNTWRWKLHSWIWVWMGKVPNWAGRTGHNAAGID